MSKVNVRDLNKYRLTKINAFSDVKKMTLFLSADSLPPLAIDVLMVPVINGLYTPIATGRCIFVNHQIEPVALKMVEDEAADLAAHIYSSINGRGGKHDDLIFDVV